MTTSSTTPGAWSRVVAAKTRSKVEEAGLDLNQIADTLGLSRRALSQRLDGSRSWEVSLLAALADILDCSILEFIDVEVLKDELGVKQ